MENRKINLDRAQISSEEIANRQDFSTLMNAFHGAPKPFWKSIWFWGPAGVASLAMLFLSKQVFFNNSENEAYDNTITLALSDIPQDTECIKAPIQGIDLPFQVERINPLQDNLLILRDGSQVFIPAGSIQTVEDGLVDISMRTFADKAEAFVAGVPMDFQKSAFESAGMIEIRGTQNGRTVTIHADKPIEVSLALTKHPEGFDFWSLDDTSGEWSIYPCEYHTPASTSEQGSAPASQESKEMREIKYDLVKLDQSIEEQTVQLELLREPTHEEFYIPTNEYRIFSLNYDKRDFPQLAALGNIKFEALPKQSNYENIFRRSWADFTIEEVDGQYSVTFSDRTSSEKINVRPVLTGDELKKAMTRYNEAVGKVTEDRIAQQMELERVREERNKKSKLLKNMARQMDQMRESGVEEMELSASVKSQQRSFAKNAIAFGAAEFRTTSFGVFNSDRPVGYPDPMSEPIIFVMAGLPVDTKDVYVFDMKRDVRFTYGTPQNPLKNLGLSNNEQVILVLMEDNSVGYVRTNKKEVESQRNHIQLQKIPLEDLSSETIKSIIHEERVSA
jgi:hypothetical protein